MKKVSLLAMLTIGVCCSFYIDHTGASKPQSAHLSIKKMPADTPAELPHSYKMRKILNDVASVSSDISAMPGNLVSFKAKDTSYAFRTLKGITKGGKPAVAITVTDGSIYSGIITPKTSFNGSRLIGGLSVGANEVMEISIRDEAIYAVPDSLIDVDGIKNATKDTPADELKNLFYVKSVTLTAVEAKKYALTKFNPAANSFYITLKGKVYGTSEKTKSGRVVSMFLIPIQKF